MIRFVAERLLLWEPEQYPLDRLYRNWASEEGEIHTLEENRTVTSTLHDNHLAENNRARSTSRGHIVPQRASAGSLDIKEVQKREGTVFFSDSCEGPPGSRLLNGDNLDYYYISDNR
jgi:hypothetical protein